MVGPWLNSLWERKKSLSDIEYLSIKDFGSKLTVTEGTLSATGDLTSVTAGAGKDMYLAKAKVSVRSEGPNVSATVIVELKINGVIKETFSAWMADNTVSDSGGTSSTNYEFAFAGKVAATQIIKLEAVTIGSGVEVNGVLVTFEEDTGVSPAI